MNAVASQQTRHIPISSGLARGAIGGLIGGMAMAMFSMFVAISRTGSGAVGASRASSLGRALRELRVLARGSGHGHMMNSVVLGAVFALVAAALLARASTALVIGAGMAFGLMVWLVMVPGVAAQAQSSELFVDSVPAWAWIAGHLMFGAITAAVFALGRRSD